MEVVHYQMVEQTDYKIPYNGVFSAINKSEDHRQQNLNPTEIILCL